MKDTKNSLRLRRLNHLHEQWCKLSDDVLRQGSTIGCVIASAHVAINSIGLGEDVDQRSGMSGREIWEYLIASGQGRSSSKRMVILSFPQKKVCRFLSFTFIASSKTFLGMD